jgi:hypothetical protein
MTPRTIQTTTYAHQLPDGSWRLSQTDGEHPDKGGRALVSIPVSREEAQKHLAKERQR